MVPTPTMNNGKLLINLDASWSTVTDAVIDAGGRATLAGYATIGNKAYLAVAQVNADGTLNKSFGTEGVFLLDATMEGIYYEIRIVPQNDGGFVLAGTTTGSSAVKVALARLTADGALDARYSGDGKAYIDAHRIMVSDVAMQPDGKLLVVGSDLVDYNGTDFAVYRVNTDGSVDSSFGSNGKIVLDQSALFLGTKLIGGDDWIKQIIVQQDGKILIGGHSRGDFEGSSHFDYSLVRLNIDGTLDNTFGKGGRLLVDAGGQEGLTGMSLLPSGNILLAGISRVDDVSNPQFVRLNSDGTVDSTFGSQGRVTLQFPVGFMGETQFAIQSDGKMVFTYWEGSTSNPFLPGTPHFGVIRTNPDGTWDTSFGIDGKVVVNIGDWDGVKSVNIQSDGKIVLSGGSTFHSAGSTFFSAVRLNTDGSLDSSFNKDRPVGVNVIGTVGSESISASTGDDVIDGGDGTDTVVYANALSTYTVRKSSGGVSVSEKTGSVSYDSLVRVERLQFSDVTVDLTSKANAATISRADLNSLTELYIAFFNRVPDAEGLGFWINAFRNGETLNQIADSFYSAAVQFASLTGYSQNMDAEAFVSLVYKNVLGRTSVDHEGLKYWSSSLVDGTESKGSLVKSILNSAHTFKGDATWGWVANLLDNKIVVGQKVAVDMGLTFNSPEQSIVKGMAIAGAVSADNIENAISLIGLAPAEYTLG